MKPMQLCGLFLLVANAPLLLTTAPARAGSLTTHAGQTLSGTLALDDDAITLTDPAGKTDRFPLSSVQRAVFIDPKPVPPVKYAADPPPQKYIVITRSVL